MKHQAVITMSGKPPPRPGRDHHMTIYRAKQQWLSDLHYLGIEAGIPKAKPLEHRTVHITFYQPGTPPDKDNMYASCKVPLDALVQCSLLWDDSPRFCTVTCSHATQKPSQQIITIGWGEE